MTDNGNEYCRGAFRAPDKTNMTRFVGDGVLDVPKVTDMQMAIFLLLLLFTSTSVLSQRGTPLGQKGEGNGKLVQNLTFPSPFFPNGSPLWTLPSLNPFFHTLCQILTVLRKTLTCLLSYNVGIVI